MPTITEFLDNHDFKGLFIEELGWDRASAAFAVELAGRGFAFQSVAQKRGVYVFHCKADRLTLLHRRLLRRVQEQAAKAYHEHILVYTCEAPRRQVWQWAVRRPDGVRLRHREHPFPSAQPPAGFVERLQLLRFSLDEEESVGLLDALERVRRALDTNPDLVLFTSYPELSARSDELARRMRNGEAGAFEAFVMLHLPLARAFSQRVHRWLGIDCEDAEQIAAMGLLKAAQRFKPEKGCQFSTYAWHWMRQMLQREGPENAQLIRIPAYVIARCLTVERARRRLEARGTASPERRVWDEELHWSPVWQKRWSQYQRSKGVRSLDDRSEPEYRAARRLVDPGEGPLERLLRAEIPEIVRRGLARLDARRAEFLRLRYGIDGEPHTLEQIGQRFGVTRERVRQIVSEAEKRLGRILGVKGVGTDSTPTGGAEKCPHCGVALSAHGHP